MVSEGIEPRSDPMKTIHDTRGRSLNRPVAWTLPAVVCLAAIGVGASSTQEGRSQRQQTRPATRPAETKPVEASESRPASRPAETGSYRNEEFGFSVQLPPGWEIREKTEGCAVIAISARENPRDDFREHVAVCAEEVRDGVTLKAYVDSLLEKYRTLNEFELNEQKDANVGQAKGTKVVYGHKQGAAHAKSVEYIVLARGKAFIVRGRCEARAFDANKALIDTFAMSFVAR
jgi:hypothetical protein